jgi:sulfur dioxygenase
MSSFTPTSTFTFGPLVFRQLFEAESSTYTYLLGDPDSKEAIIIDPVLETINRDLQLVKDLGLTLKYAINTHCHADHITSTGKMKETVPGLVTAISRASGARSDLPLEHGDVLRFGSRFITARATPGHTDVSGMHALIQSLFL